MTSWTDITILVDRSGSMSNIKDAMEEGFQGFLHEHAKNATTRISLVQFDSPSGAEKVYTSIPVSEAPKLVLTPRGGTPLMDALCTTIDDTEHRIADLPKKNRPDRVLFVIITDGQENASNRHNRADVKARITRKNEKEDWQFVYLGANQDAFAEAQSYGIAANNAMWFNANRMDTRHKMRGMTSNTVAYASTGAGASLSWSPEQAKEATED